MSLTSRERFLFLPRCVGETGRHAELLREGGAAHRHSLEVSSHIIIDTQRIAELAAELSTDH